MGRRTSRESHPMPPIGQTEGGVALFRHDDHPPADGGVGGWTRPQNSMGVAPAARDRSLCRAGDRCRWTRAWRHTHPLPGRGVHTCHGRKSGLTAAADGSELVTRVESAGQHARGKDDMTTSRIPAASIALSLGFGLLCGAARRILQRKTRACPAQSLLPNGWRTESGRPPI